MLVTNMMWSDDIKYLLGLLFRKLVHFILLDILYIHYFTFRPYNESCCHVESRSSRMYLGIRYIIEKTVCNIIILDLALQILRNDTKKISGKWKFTKLYTLLTSKKILKHCVANLNKYNSNINDIGWWYENSIKL